MVGSILYPDVENVCVSKLLPLLLLKLSVKYHGYPFQNFLLSTVEQ